MLLHKGTHHTLRHISRALEMFLLSESHAPCNVHTATAPPHPSTAWPLHGRPAGRALYHPSCSLPFQRAALDGVCSHPCFPPAPVSPNNKRPFLSCPARYWLFLTQPWTLADRTAAIHAGVGRIPPDGDQILFKFAHVLPPIPGTGKTSPPPASLPAIRSGSAGGLQWDIHKEAHHALPGPWPPPNSAAPHA